MPAEKWKKITNHNPPPNLITTNDIWNNRKKDHRPQPKTDDVWDGIGDVFWWCLGWHLRCVLIMSGMAFEMCFDKFVIQKRFMNWNGFCGKRHLQQFHKTNWFSDVHLVELLQSVRQFWPIFLQAERHTQTQQRQTKKNHKLPKWAKAVFLFFFWSGYWVQDCNKQCCFNWWSPNFFKGSRKMNNESLRSLWAYHFFLKCFLGTHCRNLADLDLLKRERDRSQCTC